MIRVGCLVFRSSHTAPINTMMMTVPRTMASSCVWNRVKLNPLMMMLAKAPRPDVGSDVRTWIMKNAHAGGISIRRTDTQKDI